MPKIIGGSLHEHREQTRQKLFAALSSLIGWYVWAFITYFVGTRILKPLLAQASGGKVDPAKPEMEWNRWWGLLPAWGDYGCGSAKNSPVMPKPPNWRQHCYCYCNGRNSIAGP